MLLGCVADDLTGATDLALMLTREGLRTVQSTGLPPADLDVSQVDAVVVALKSRTIFSMSDFVSPRHRMPWPETSS